MKVYRTKFLAFIITLVLALGQIAFAQNGFRIEYKVISGFPDTPGTLVVLSKNCNSSNIITSDKNGRVLYKNVRLKEDPSFSYDYLGDGFSKTDEHFKSDSGEFDKYEVSVIGDDTIRGIKCKKVSIKIDNNLTGVIMWIAEIPKYDLYSDAYVFRFNLAKLNTALKELGIHGFPIRIVCKAYDTQIYEFVGAEKKRISKSSFAVNVTREGYSSEYLKNKKGLSEEKYKAMKDAEEAAKKNSMEKLQKK